MLTTFSELWRAPRLHAQVPIALTQQWVTSRFRDIVRKRLWSWRVKQGQFLIPAATTGGTVTVTRGSTVVTGTSGTWTSALVGQQFRVGVTAPIYTVVSVDSPTTLTLDDQWGGITASGVGYIIFQAYITPAADFHDFISVRDVNYNWQLHLHVSQQWLNGVDAQRANSGNPYCIADLFYNQSPTAGSVRNVSRVVGTGDSPVSGGTYTGRTNSNFIVTVTTGGAVGTAVFSWRKDDGTTAAGNVTTEAPYELQEGVTVAWPSGLTFVLNDVFVVTVTPGFTAGIPMYELWPYQYSQTVYPYLYDRKMPDLDDPDGVLPPFIQGDVLVKGALADLARWPGTASQPNPAFDLRLADSYEKEFQFKVAEMERDDDEVYETDLTYWRGMPFAPAPWMDARWAQSHEVAAGVYF